MNSISYILCRSIHNFVQVERDGESPTAVAGGGGSAAAQGKHLQWSRWRRYLDHGATGSIHSAMAGFWVPLPPNPLGIVETPLPLALAPAGKVTMTDAISTRRGNHWAAFRGTSSSVFSLGGLSQGEFFSSRETTPFCSAGRERENTGRRQWLHWGLHSLSPLLGRVLTMDFSRRPEIGSGEFVCSCEFRRHTIERFASDLFFYGFFFGFSRFFILKNSRFFSRFFVIRETQCKKPRKKTRIKNREKNRESEITKKKVWFASPLCTHRSRFFSRTQWSWLNCSHELQKWGPFWMTEPSTEAPKFETLWPEQIPSACPACEGASRVGLPGQGGERLARQGFGRRHGGVAERNMNLFAQNRDLASPTSWDHSRFQK